MDIQSILDRVKAPETSVTLCLEGPLVAEYERLDEQLRDVSPATSLAGDGSSARLVASRMHDLRAQMLGAEVTFTFRALPPRPFSDYRATMPDRKEGQPPGEYADAWHEWVCGLINLCCVDPGMTAEQADRLSQGLSDAQWTRLTNAAWLVNAGKQTVPFSDAAFVLTLTSEPKSQQPEPPASPEAGSLAGPASSAPSTSTDPTGA